MIISPKVTEKNLNKFLPELKAFLKDTCDRNPIEVYDKDLSATCSATSHSLDEKAA